MIRRMCLVDCSGWSCNRALVMVSFCWQICIKQIDECARKFEVDVCLYRCDKLRVSKRTKHSKFPLQVFCDSWRSAYVLESTLNSWSIRWLILRIHESWKRDERRVHFVDSRSCTDWSKPTIQYNSKFLSGLIFRSP